MSVSSIQPEEHAPSRIVITNFRICFLPLAVTELDSISQQISLGSVSSMTMQTCQITIGLKFDSLQYIISQAPHGPLRIAEIFMAIQRVIYNEDSNSRFPFLMGRKLLGLDIKEDIGANTGQKRKVINDKKAPLKTAEDIIASLSDNDAEISEQKDKHGSQTEDSKRRVKLGWEGGFKLSQEFERLQYNNNLWTIADINLNYELSPTYPEQFIMPVAFLGLDDRPNTNSQVTGLPSKARIQLSGYSQDPNPYPPPQTSSLQPRESDAFIRQLVIFRSNKRFPIICWKAPSNGLILMRSAQPMVGLLGARGPEDELYIRTVLSTACKEHQILHGHKVAPKLCIMDARAYSSAVANGYLGGGRENPGWLTHVADVLKAASGQDGIIGKMLDDNSSVLVHCTDGWDRTTQLVSLAQILLDPYYRTIQGLRVLIEKEWISCGHPFHSRTENLPDQKRSTASAAEEEISGSWKPNLMTIHSSPNGAKETPSYSRKWLNRIYGDQEPRLDPNSTPSCSYHLDSYQQKESKLSPPAQYALSDSLNFSQSRIFSTSQNQGTSYPQSINADNIQPSQTIPISPSPVFLLFLTCVHHIVQQHPNHFEFNDYLLLVLARAASGHSPFGDFLFNSESERAHEGVRKRTPSIWKWAMRNRGWFTNRDFIRHSNMQCPSWRDNVLKIQTGGRYTTLWTEYYFNTTPNWFPDSRTVLSMPIYLYGSKEKEVLHISRQQAKSLQASWFSSRFDQTQLQMLTFPGLSVQQHARPTSTLLYLGTRMTIIPPDLALLRGQEMYTYYMLIQYLRNKRKRQVERALLRWKKWTKKQKEARSAQEAGWDLGSVSEENGSQEDTTLDNQNSSGDDSDDCGDGDIGSQYRTGPLGSVPMSKIQSKKCNHGQHPPKLKIINARMGIQNEIERMIEGGSFFGEGPVKHDMNDSNEEIHIEANMREAVETQMETLMDNHTIDQDDLDESFDDFGFPVSVVQGTTKGLSR
ncbi:hypothetical protein FBU30_010268 [Linnemannia zychae]|nr:hypothetical protein FBU30_010268 [Linnemannia zychae]